MSVEWKGNIVKRHVNAATADAIDECTQAAADDASGSHWWSNRTGDLEAGIGIEKARTVDGHLRGLFEIKGSRGDLFYGVILEHKRPFMRPAADRNFPDLPGKIRKRLITRLI